MPPHRPQIYQFYGAYWEGELLSYAHNTKWQRLVPKAARSSYVAALSEWGLLQEAREEWESPYIPAEQIQRFILLFRSFDDLYSKDEDVRYMAGYQYWKADQPIGVDDSPEAFDRAALDHAVKFQDWKVHQPIGANVSLQSFDEYQALGYKIITR